MSPAKSFNLNGPRPSALLIHKDSRTIRKPAPPPLQLREPVIIYTHSPKIIHTEPKDFMALVQRLTGKETAKNNQLAERNFIDNDCSSVLTDDDDHRHIGSLLSSDTSPFSSPGLVNSLSPSFLAFLKGLPEI